MPRFGDSSEGAQSRNVYFFVTIRLFKRTLPMPASGGGHAADYSNQRDIFTQARCEVCDGGHGCL